MQATARASVAGQRFLPRSSGVIDAGPALMVLAFVAVPATFIPLALAHGGPLIVVPYQHFYIVSAVSLIAALIAGLLAVTTIQIGLYRVLFICLGFMSMGAIFAVHGLTTPGILVPNLFARFAGSAVAASAYLSLAVPAVFFAAGYVPGMDRLERRLPFWPAGWLVVFVTAALVAYGTIAIKTWMLAQLPLSLPPYSTALAVASIALFFLAAFGQARTYRRTRLETQANLVVAFVLLAEAAAAMVLFPVWSWGWWYYHLLMLAAVGLAFRTLLVARVHGRSFRSVVESALQLEVSVANEEIDVEAVAALVAAVEVKDRETQGHNHRVAELCVKIGRELGMNASDLRTLARAGLLHDVGKLGIPDAILHKRGPLTDEEWVVMKTHPEIGLKILKRCGHFRRELLAVLYHHEHVDGTGYPHGLAGEAIPIEARIVAVADTYDVLTSDRPYRRALSESSAVETVAQAAGTHLDARLVHALLRTVRPSAEPSTYPERHHSYSAS
ncbi:MAG TPA: HD domain-containing phosphohydrolase [Candidatus Dormibacteraeota bacterium]|nr:HD domain-containing phosphohydrolase [Candidatus Dormibacteraeota bacterium]